MTESELFEFVKRNIAHGITSDAYDDTIRVLISSGKSDIESAIGSDFDLSNMDHVMALTLYVKSRFGSLDEKNLYWNRYQEDLTRLGIRNGG